MAIGDYIVDLSELQSAGLLSGVSGLPAGVFDQVWV